MRSTAKSSCELTGWWAATRSCLRRETASSSSSRITAKLATVRPCLRAFWADRAALARLAARRRGEMFRAVAGMDVPGFSNSMGAGWSLRLGGNGGRKEGS